MARSLWKGCFQKAVMQKKNFELKVNPRSFRLWNRSSVVSMNFVGKSVVVYKGKGFKNLTITKEHVGFKFGAFAFTRKFTVKEKKKLKKK